jgi:F0F1-type ATP synthase beta subunit
LHCQLDGDQCITAVVHAHLDRSTVQAIAIDSTRGLRYGSRVACEGSPLVVPVGSNLLGRVLDLHGRPIDGGPEFHNVQPASIYHPPLVRPTGDPAVSCIRRVLKSSTSSVPSPMAAGQQYSVGPV